MSQIRIVICRVNEKNPAEMKEIASYDLPKTEIRTLDAERALDEMEATLHKQGQVVLKRALQAQFEEMERDLVEAYRQGFPPEDVTSDGHSAVTVVSRFGRLELNRQVLNHRQSHVTGHVMPGNQALPTHNGVIITRGV